MSEQTIAFIGTGNMSHAIIGGMVSSGFAKDRIIATNRNAEKLAKVKNDFGVQTETDNLAALKKADVIVLAVKPQMMADLCKTFASSGIDYKNKLFISIMAGVTIKRLHSLLAHPVRIIRCMPNTPALLGEGVSGLFAQDTTDADNQFAQSLFESTGIVIWLKNESDINSITAMSGSSPAYFFLFMEAMEQKAKDLGFSDEQARKVVQQVASGAAKMVEEQDISIAQLRANVTSKGGTTAAALAHFEQKLLGKTVAEAMDKCIARAKQMELEF